MYKKWDGTREEQGKQFEAYWRSPSLDERWLWFGLEWWSWIWREVTTFEIYFTGRRVGSWKWSWLGGEELGLDMTLRVLEARSLKSKCQQGHAPSGDSRGESILPLPASCGCWHFLACVCITLVCVSMVTLPPHLLRVGHISPYLPLIRTLMMTFSSHIAWKSP